MKRLIAVLVLAAVAVYIPATAHAQRAASYAKQSSGGYPLIAAGRIDTAAVQYLARFDDVTLEAAPWAMNVNGTPRADVPLMLRQLNPRIRLWLYVLTGDFWLPPTFVPQAGDRSSYRLIFDAVNAGNGWLYDTDGAQWFPDYRVNLADSATVRRLGDIYISLVALRLWDGIVLDDCSTSIAWTSGTGRNLDVQRAGFATLAAMDSARLSNATKLISRLHSVGGCGFMVCVNGTGPTPKGTDVTFREGVGSLISVSEAKVWMASPGKHWLKMECYSPEQCAEKWAAIKLIGGRSTNIVSGGPDRGWPPEAKP